MLANVVAMCTGMRAAEIASLQYKDLGETCIYVRHSWNAKDGLKTTKNKENRIALLPFPSIINAQQQEFGAIENSLPKFDFSDKQKLYENIKTGYMDKSGLYAHSRQDR